MSSTSIKQQIRRATRPSQTRSLLPGDDGRNENTPSLSGHLLTRPLGYQSGETLWETRTKTLEDAWRLLISSHVNILLVFLPFGLLSGGLRWPPIATFALNFLSIIPLQSLISYLTGEAALLLGQSLGGLQNSVLGSATELIVGMTALAKDESRLVQASIMGSIFSNMLLTPGASLFVGGLGHLEQHFNITIVSTLLFPTMASTLSLVVPTALHSLSEVSVEQHKGCTALSIGCAVVLLLLHVAHLFFRIKTHADTFDYVEATDMEELELLEPEVDLWTAAIGLPLILMLIIFCARFLISSLAPVVDDSNLSRTFFGFVLFPFLNGCADQLTAVIVAYKNDVGLALGVCIAAIMQTVLFATPILVILGAMSGHPLSLYFNSLEAVAILFATGVFVALLQRGYTNYFDGILCLGFYSVVVIAFVVLT